MGQLLGPDFPPDIALAVSGGGDSMAMLYLAHNWTRDWGVRLHVVTVDHGLRPESAGEAAMVARECAALGWPHTTLKWTWDGKGNLQDAARQARLHMINRWRGLIEHVLMAHTQDDVAETFLMRLARGSGVDGLSAMSDRRKVELGPTTVLQDAEFDGPLPPQSKPGKGTRVRPGSFHVVRPCLGMRRSDLRHYLKVLNGPWVDDPSNDNTAFERVRVRQALSGLTELGLDVDTLAGTAHRMSRARFALRQRALDAWQEFGAEGRLPHKPEPTSSKLAPLRKNKVQASVISNLPSLPLGPETGELLFQREPFEAADRETQLRLLSAALQFVSGADYRPRATALDALLDRLLGGGTGTLHGCECQMERTQLRVSREFAVVAGHRVSHGASMLWDNRWRVFSAQWRDVAGLEVRALGEAGWQQVDSKPEGAPPFRSARSLPALWAGSDLLACDALGFGPGMTSHLWPMGRERLTFAEFLLSH